jgi:hypothetical protein
MGNKLMRKLIKLISILFAFIFLGMQFVPTATTPKTSVTRVGLIRPVGEVKDFTPLADVFGDDP